MEQKNRLIRAMQMLGSVVQIQEDEDRVLDMVTEQVISAAQIRSLTFAMVDEMRQSLEVVRTARFVNLDDGRLTSQSPLRIQRHQNRHLNLDHPTAICRAVRESPLVIVDGDDPELKNDPDYYPNEWKNKVAYFVALNYEDECVGVFAGACPLDDIDTALAWLGPLGPLFSIAAAQIKTMRLLKQQRFLSYQPPREAKLSDQEYEVLRRVALGESSTGIAEGMDLSPRTVHTYRRRICEKLERHSQADLTRYAIMIGLIPLADR